MLCAPILRAQTLDDRYLELADSVDYYMKHQQWQQAEKSIVEALKTQPANPSNYLLWSNLGVVRTELNKFNEALTAFEIGLAGAPKSTVILTNRARTLLLTGDLENAKKDLDLTLALDSTQLWPHKMRGLLEMQNKHYLEAEKDFDFIARHSECDADVLAALGDIKAANGDIKASIECFNNSLAKQEDENTLFKLLLLLTKGGDAKEARIRTVNAINKYPDNGNLHIIRALQHQQDYQREFYIKERKKATDLGADPILVNEILGK